MAATEVKQSPFGGRGLFATTPISSGDVLIHLERPLIAVLDEARVQDTCSWCFSWTELPIPSLAGINQALKVNWCTGCRKVKYCSKRCQAQAWKTGHKKTCKSLAALEDGMPGQVAALMEVLAGMKADDELYKEVQKMETHRDELEKLGAEKWRGLQLMAHKAVKSLGEKDDQANVERAIMALCAVIINNSRLVTPTFDPLGLVLDPRTSFINHSCAPNAVVSFDVPKLYVRALDPIPEGGEIFISYVDSSGPFGVRQAELKDQYFFTCTCSKCKLGSNAPQDAFLKPTDEFEDRIKVTDEMIPQILNDPAWPRHQLGDSIDQKRLSALQFYAYSYLNSPEIDIKDPTMLRKAITICRNSGVWPVTRAPLPALYHQYAVACLGAKRYNEALVAMIRRNVLIDPVVYPQPHHPVRVVHTWTLATLAKAVSDEPDSPFCKALQACGVDLPILFLALLDDVHEQVPKSHGKDTAFGRMIESAWQTIMGPGGELDVEYSQRGVQRAQQQRLLEQQVTELWPKVKAFAADDALAAEIDEALVG